MTTVAVQIGVSLVRAGIVSRLATVDGVTVVAQSADVVDLLTQLSDDPGRTDIAAPDAIVIECDRPSTAAVDDAVTSLMSQLPDVGIVGLHSDLPAVRMIELQRLGVRCLVDRSSGFDALVAALVDPARPTRRRWLAPTVGPLPLTDRESQVLAFISEGRTAKEIAEELGISGRTVEAHKQRAYAKLGVQNQAHAVSAALRAKQLPPPSLIDSRVGDIRSLPATGTESGS